jgi:hypothetical protein
VQPASAHLRRAFPALVACVPLFLEAQAGGIVGADAWREVRTVLRRRPNDQQSPAELAAALARLGPEHMPVYLEIAAGRGLELLVGEGELPVEQWACAPEECPALALRALASFPPPEVLALLTERVAAPSEPGERLVALRLVGLLESARDSNCCGSSQAALDQRCNTPARPARLSRRHWRRSCGRTRFPGPGPRRALRRRTRYATRS